MLSLDMLLKFCEPFKISSFVRVRFVVPTLEVLILCHWMMIRYLQMQCQMQLLPLAANTWFDRITDTRRSPVPSLR